VLARILERVSKLDSGRVLEEAMSRRFPYRTVERQLRAFVKDSWPAVGGANDRVTGARCGRLSCSTVAAPAWTATPPPGACGGSRRPRGFRRSAASARGAPACG
jgi:hypothetical protein